MLRKPLSVLSSAVLLAALLAPVTKADTSPDFSVWVPTNSEKVLRDQAFPAGAESGSQHLEMGAARNEYESGQVIVKAGDTPLRKLQVSVSELKQTNGSAKIRQEDIQLFREHYIQVTKPTTGAFPAGWYPDALVPLDGFLDVPANQNQGIWIKVKVPKGQEPGDYTGTVTLHETGNPIVIPVRLTVWDFELTDESHSETAFTLWGDQISYAHNGVQGEEFWKLLDKYYWASVDSRIVPSYLPVPTGDIDQFIQLAEPYILNPKVTSYRLPLYLDAQSQPDWAKTKLLVDRLREKGLLAKAFFYLGGQIDEPAPAVFPKVRDYAQKMKEIAPDVRHFVTTQPTDELVPDVNNWIALINKYDKDYAQERQAAGDHVWWYTSVNPKHPFPSYHIDDELLSARLLSWMQKDYGVEGNLFWSTTIFKKYDGKQYVPRDVWTDPLAFPGANGDGYLFYPGTQLGIDGPVGTIRLEAIREGMEDYEYLWQLEQHIKETAARLGVKDYPVHDSLQFYYDRLYKNIRSFADDPANLLDVRADVAEEITSTDKGPLALVGVTGTGGTRQLTIHTEPGAEVRLGDRVLAPSEKGASYDKFTAEAAVHNGPNEAVLTITRDGMSRTLTKIIQVNGEEPTVPVVFQDAETPADLQKLTSSTVNLSLSDEYVTNGQHSLKAEFKGGVKFPNFRMMDAGKGIPTGDWSKYKALEFDVHNVGETANFYVKFHQTNGKTDDTFIQFVRPDRSKTIHVDLSDIALDLTQMKGIEIWMWQQPEAKVLYFDNFRFLTTASGS